MATIESLLRKNSSSKAKKKPAKQDSYADGKEFWDYQIAKENRSLKKWQAIAIGSLALTAWVVITLVPWATEPKLVPYVVNVDQDGKIDFLGVIQNQKINITDAMVRFYLTNFVRGLRTISSDLAILKRDLQEVYYLATVAAQSQITEMIQTDSPLEKNIRGERVDVKFEEYNRMAESTWRVQWLEETRQEGRLINQTRMVGIFSYTLQLPSAAVEAERNPLGLYFSDFNISERR